MMGNFFLARLDGSWLTNLCSASRRCGEYAFTAQVERPGRIDCTTRFCCRPYTFHGAYDQVFCSAWKRRARKLIKASHIWSNIKEITNIIIYRNANPKGITFVQIHIISVTLIVVAVPEGLPLVVTLALAFSLLLLRQNAWPMRSFSYGFWNLA